jgi:hypothetical protein
METEGIIKRCASDILRFTCLAILLFASLPLAGITSSIMQLPGNEYLVGEHPWTVRFLIYHCDHRIDGPIRYEIDLILSSWYVRRLRFVRQTL